MQIRISILNILVLFISFTSCSKYNTTNTKQVVTPGDTTGRITIGPLTQIYSDPQMPYTMDASWATLKNADGSIQVYQFAKYNNGSWTENAFTGTGSNIIPDFEPPFDFHSDATYCKPLGKYLITVQTHGLNKIFIPINRWR